MQEVYLQLKFGRVGLVGNSDQGQDLLFFRERPFTLLADV